MNDSSKNYPDGISRTSSGDWKIRVVRADPRTHKRREKKWTLPNSATLKDAVLKHDELVQEILSGGRPKQGGWTVTAYAASWLNRRLPRLASDLTRERYQLALDNHILPMFGDWMIEAIDSMAIDEWMVKPRNRFELHDEMPARALLPKREPEPYSPDTINGWWRIFKMMLQDAVNELGLPRDPTLGVRPLPKRTKIDKETNTLTAEEVTTLFTVCQRDYPQWFAFIVLGFAIGARPGELRPLRWGTDLDLDTGKLTLRQSQSRRYVGPTKTKTEREMLLPPEVIEVLRWHKIWLKNARHPAADGPLVFPPSGTRWRPGRWRSMASRAPATNNYLAASALDRPFAAMIEASKISRHITPKAFRRTFNDIARKAAGLNNVVTRALTGHQSIEMQETYSTVDLQEKRAGLTKVFSLFKVDTGT
jgi:integrase